MRATPPPPLRCDLRSPALDPAEILEDQPEHYPGVGLDAGVLDVRPLEIDAEEQAFVRVGDADPAAQQAAVALGQVVDRVQRGVPVRAQVEAQGALDLLAVVGEVGGGGRSEARRVGQEGGSQCRSRWSPYD